MNALKLFGVVLVFLLGAFLIAEYGQPKMELVDRGEWHKVPDDMPAMSRNLLCSMTECRYNGTELLYYAPRYVVVVDAVNRALVAVLIAATVFAAAATAYAASRIEDISTKKAVAVLAAVYGAGMTVLMFTRKDFRAAAPLLAPLAAALLLAAVILYILLRAAGHEIRLRK